MARRNPELPGVERESDEQLDDACEAYCDRKRDLESADEELTKAREHLYRLMAGKREGLEKDGKGRPCYLFAAGGEARVFSLEPGPEKLKERKAKRAELGG